ncbi:MAG: WYL domain-containing transcriptional regulator [Gemmataceae bacterium]|nr:WYL domain-containing transcriptional regulator [Gemmataceae bacterium]
MTETEQVRRAARLPLIEQILRKAPQGMTTRELASRTGTSVRTAERDLNVIETELGVPLMTEGRRWKIMPGAPAIGSVRFTLQEARAIFLAARLYLRHTDHNDPAALAALQKLAEALPPALASHATAGIVQHRQKPDAPEEVEVTRRLTEAWAASRTVRLSYRSQRTKAVEQTELDPHLLEPGSELAATYVIGFSHQHGEVRTFKIDRVGAVELTDDHFEPPDRGALLANLAHGWGVVYVGDEEHHIVIDFSPAVASRVQETTWHASQRTSPAGDGGVRLEVTLPSLLEIVPWIRGWGPEARVIAPEALRAEIASSLRGAARQYE